MKTIKTVPAIDMVYSPRGLKLKCLRKILIGFFSFAVVGVTGLSPHQAVADSKKTCSDHQHNYYFSRPVLTRNKPILFE